MQKSLVLKFYDMKHVETALNPSNIRFPESFRKTDSEAKCESFLLVHKVTQGGAPWRSNSS